MVEVRTKKCLICGKKFKKPSSCSLKEWNKTRKYCSKECCLLGTFKNKNHKVWNKGLVGYNKNYPRNKKWCEKISLSNKGKPHLNQRGKNHGNWKGGISKETDKIRHSIDGNLWRWSVFARDNFTCQKTKTRGGDLCAHHIQNFIQYPELRFAIDNGITLSKEAHKEFHKKYGVRDNTQEQLKEFLCH